MTDSASASNPWSCGPRALILRVAAVLSILGLFTAFGLRQVGGMDIGVLTNTAWMSHLGYRPYRDFLTGVPPLFIAGAKLAFTVEASFRILVLFAAVVSAAALLIHDNLLRRAGLSQGWSLATAWIVQCVTFLPFTVWWYNPMTAVAIALLLTAALTLAPGAHRNVGGVAFGLLVAAAALSKPNVGLPAAVFSGGLVLAISPGRSFVRRAVVAATVECAVVFGFIGASPADMLRNYATWSRRVGSLGNARLYFWEVEHSINALTYLLLTPALGAMLVILLAVRGRWRVLRIEVGIVLFTLGMAVVAWVTNNDFKMIDAAPFIAVATIVATRVSTMEGKVGVARYGTIVCLVVFILLAGQAVVVSAKRERVRAVESGAFYQKLPLRPIETTRFFRDVDAGPRLVALVPTIQRLLDADRAKLPPGTAVFFGPRIDWAYATFGLAPVHGLPLWWEAFRSPPESVAPTKVFEESHVGIAIFLAGSFTFLPNGLIGWLISSWCQAPAPDLSVFVRPVRGECPVGVVEKRGVLMVVP